MEYLSEEAQKRIDALVASANEEAIKEANEKGAKEQAQRLEEANQEIASRGIWEHQKEYYRVLKKHGQPVPETALKQWPDLDKK